MKPQQNGDREEETGTEGVKIAEWMRLGFTRLLEMRERHYVTVLGEGLRNSASCQYRYKEVSLKLSYSQ